MARRSFGSVRKLPSGRWQARYLGPDGKRHQGHGTFTREAWAARWLDSERLLIEDGRWTPPATRNPNAALDETPTLAEYAESVISRRETRARKPLRPRTAQGYRQLVRLTMGEIGALRLSDITPGTIAEWHAGISAHPTQAGHAYALLRSIMADAVDEELIDRSPCRLKGAGRPEPARNGEALTALELAEYVAAAEPAYRAALAVAAWCSLRSGEIRGLRRCDVADDAAVLHVRQAVGRLRPADGKAGWVIGAPKTAAGARSVAVPEPAQPLLLGVLATHDRANRDPKGLLFPATDGRTPLYDTVLYKAHRRAAKTIGRENLTLHDLRRTGATLAAQAGATTREVMRRLGHTRPDVAMRYQVADDARDRAVADAMSRL